MIYNFISLALILADSSDLTCMQIECNFEQGEKNFVNAYTVAKMELSFLESLCSYENYESEDDKSSSVAPTKQWTLTQGRQSNLATGVRNAGKVLYVYCSTAFTVRYSKRL